ncbi:MAG: acyltransferase [Roseomonas sp.]|nr:acyltransferase [Roseomonas sp.]
MPRKTSGVTEGGRIVFLDYLRAIAVILVIWGHIFIVGVNNPEVIRPWLPSVTENAFGSSIVFTNTHGLIDLFFMLNFGISSGPLGVAIFFIISGFVILRSVDRLPPGAFLIQRAFRIFPLCAAVVAGVAVFTFFYCAASGLPSPHTLYSVAASSFAASGFFQVMGTLPVLWSLTAELLFYLLMAAAARLFSHIGFRALLGMACTFLAAIWAINTPAFAAVMPPLLTYELVYASSMLIHVIFMLVGAVFYRGLSSSRNGAAIVYAAIIFGLYLASYAIYRDLRGNAGIGATPADAVAAQGIFLAAFWTRLSWRWLRPLKFVADISYPLYLVHVPLGWAVLVWLGSMGWSHHLAALTATTAMALLAWVLHVSIETPSQRLGKLISRHRSAKTAFAPAALSPIGTEGDRKTGPIAPFQSFHQARRGAEARPNRQPARRHGGRGPSEKNIPAAAKVFSWRCGIRRPRRSG